MAKIAGITIELNGDTRKLQASFREVDGQLRTTQKNLKDINKLLKLDPKNTELLTQKQKNLENAITETNERLKNLRQLQSKVSEGSQEWDTLQREIIATEQDLKSLKKQYRQFGSVAAQQIAAVGEKMKSIGSKVSDVGKKMTTYVTVPIVAAGAKSVNSFAEVDKTMQLANKTMNNTADEAKLLDKAMSSAAENSTFGMSDAAQAALNFARAGLDAKQAAAALAPAMNLAAGEGGDLDTVSQGLVATINGFQDSFDNASHYADIFTAACNNSALDVDSLVSSMSTAAPVFNAAGYAVDDAALYMGIMANNGIEASEAANSLKTGFAKLVDPAKEGDVWLRKLGFSIVDNEGKMKDTVTIQRELHDSFSQLSEAQQIEAASAIFGKNQMAKWLALINTSPQDVVKLSKALDKSKGKTEEMAKAMMVGFGGSIEKLKSSLDVLMVSLGRLAAQYLQPVIDKVQAWIDKFNGLDESQKKTILKIAGIVAAIGPLLLIGGKLITGIGMLLAFAPFVVSAFSVLISPIGLVVAAIAAAIAIGVLLYKNWDKIKAAAVRLKTNVVEAWNNMKAGVSAAVQSLRDYVSSVWETIRAKVSNVVNSIKATVTNTWNAIKTKVTSTTAAIKSSVTNTWNSLKSSVSSVSSSMRTSISNAWNGIKTAVANAVSNVKSSIQGAIDKLNSIRSTAQDVVDSIRSIFSGSISFPHIRLPHFSVYGGEAPYGLGGRGSMPSISVEWYKKAYDNPVMFTSPTVLATPSGYKGFGDGNGAEIVMSLEKLREVVGSNQNVSVNVVLQGDARELFKVVKQTNYARTKATNYNALAVGG